MDQLVTWVHVFFLVARCYGRFENTPSMTHENPSSQQPVVHDIARLSAEVEAKYPELLNPAPPDDPQERTAYYDRLYAQFPKEGTLEFGVLILLLCTHPSESTWKSPELWAEYAKRKNVERTRALMRVFTPLAKQVANRANALCAHVEAFPSSGSAPEVAAYRYDENTPVRSWMLPLLEHDTVRLDLRLERLRFGSRSDQLWGESAADQALKLAVDAQETSMRSGAWRNIPADELLGLVQDGLWEMRRRGFADYYERLSSEQRQALLGLLRSQEQNGANFLKRMEGLGERAFPIGHFDTFLFSPLPPIMEEVKKLPGLRTGLPAEAVMVPVEAGERRFAQAMVRATYLLVEEAIASTLEQAPALQSANDDLLFRHTARVQLVDTLIEGILSVKDACVLLVADRRPGQDPLERLERVIDADLVNHLARLFPVGYIAPLVLTGRYIPGLTQESQDGDVSFSELIETHTNAMRREIRDKNIKNGAGVPSYNMGDGHRVPGVPWGHVPAEVKTAGTANTGFGCPVAHRPPGEETSGLTELGRAFARLVRACHEAQ